MPLIHFMDCLPYDRVAWLHCSISRSSAHPPLLLPFPTPKFQPSTVGQKEAVRITCHCTHILTSCDSVPILWSPCPDLSFGLSSKERSRWPPASQQNPSGSDHTRPWSITEVRDAFVACRQSVANLPAVLTLPIVVHFRLRTRPRRRSYRQRARGLHQCQIALQAVHQQEEAGHHYRISSR